MEAKKSPKADLESRRNLFLEAGLIFSLSLALLAFEWSSPVRNHINFTNQSGTFDDQDHIEITVHEMPKPIPAPPTFTSFAIVNNTEITDDFPVIDAETFPSEEIPVYIKEKLIDLPEETSADNDDIFKVVEEQPEYPGGYDEMRKFLARNIKYPELAKTVNISGKVYLRFVVEKDGSVSNISVDRGIGGGCEEEAIRVLKLMPVWNPGKQRGKPVRVSFGIPVEFRLQ